MKKQLTIFSFSVLVIFAIAFTAVSWQEKKNNEKKQQQNPGKKEVKGNQGNQGNQGNKDVKGNQGNQGNQGNKDVKGNQGNQGNQGNKDVKGNQGNNDGNMNKDNKGRDYGYECDRENFKDRRKFKNQDKVTLCHKFNRGDDPGVTIRVSSNALKAHMAHGDVMGDCPAVTNRRFSDIFMRKRTDYYNQLQLGQEQLIYSQSILDYALSRLNDSRQQLVIYETSNMAPAIIVQKRATVVELEQNVSLLETLVGAVANML